MKEKKFLGLPYSVISIKRKGINEYYLARDGYGDLLYMYGTPTKCEPTAEMVEEYIQTAISDEFWKD